MAKEEMLRINIQDKLLPAAGGLRADHYQILLRDGRELWIKAHGHRIVNGDEVKLTLHGVEVALFIKSELAGFVCPVTTTSDPQPDVTKETA